ncbi:MAG: hypothetical protein KA764_07685 [Anaerolineales bacterium]|nr:hypothetical protein [Anaerolineales bacterium]
MSPLQLVSLGLDLILIALGLFTYVRRPKVGGLFSRGFRVLLVGLVILGFSHMIETGLFVLFNFDQNWNEIVHRLLVVIAFGFVLWGFNRLQRALDG